jgi:hypothetical protein
LIREATHWPDAEKRAAIDWVFGHQHPFLTEDIAWAGKYLGLTEADCRNVFCSADRLFVVWLKSSPVYLFGYGKEKIVSTASSAGLKGCELEMTKTCIRFGRSERGRQALAGTVGHVEATDIVNGLVRARWLEAIGYRRDGQVTHSGQTFDRFIFQG